MEKNLFILIFLFEYINTKKFYSVDELYEKLRKETYGKSEEYFNQIIEETKKIFENYAFLNIQKNPPQPDIDSNYFDKVDIMEKLDEIETKNQSVFDFYKKYYDTIGYLKDFHTQPFINTTKYPFHNYIWTSPIFFNVTKNSDGIIEMYLRNRKYIKYYEKIKNGAQTLEMLKNNVNISVKSINGKKPIDYIQDFGGPSFNTKSKSGSYSVKLNLLHSSQSFIRIPNENDLKLKIEYDNNDIIDTEFLILNNLEEEQEENHKLNFIYKKFSEYYQKQLEIDSQNIYKNLKSVDYYFNKFKKLNKYEIDDLFFLKIKNENIKEVKWTIEGKDSKNNTYFQCLVDESRKANVIKLLSFSIEVEEEYDYILDTYEKCILLFDENTYPIIVIMDNLFPGGKSAFSDFVLNTISPLFTGHFLHSFSESNSNKILINMECFINNTNPVTCKKYTNDIYQKSYNFRKEVDYGNGIKEYYLLPFVTIEKERIKNIKKKLKNPKKPTEIIIFTDGFSYSAGSGFIKGIQKNGAGIIAEFNGNPEIEYSDAS